MNVPSLETIGLAREGRRLNLTLNRPDKLNAFNAIMERELNVAFDFMRDDPESDVIVLTGAGRAFSAGADFAYIDELRAAPETFDIALAKRTATGILDCEKPVIARINGDAVGLGATLALLCDVSFIVRSATIGDPHVNVGYAAGDGSVVIWPWLVGHNRAKEYLFTGRLIQAEAAERMGLVNHCVADDELDTSVDAFVKALLRQPQLALRWTKRAANIVLRQQMETVLEASLAYEAMTIRTSDHAEAVGAIREKRRPVFTGR